MSREAIVQNTPSYPLLSCSSHHLFFVLVLTPSLTTHPWCGSPPLGKEHSVVIRLRVEKREQS